MFNKEDLILIRQVFGQANFPGNVSGRIAGFIQKVEGLIMEADKPKEVDDEDT